MTIYRLSRRSRGGSTSAFSDLRVHCPRCRQGVSVGLRIRGDLLAKFGWRDNAEVVASFDSVGQTWSVEVADDGSGNRICRQGAAGHGTVRFTTTAKAAAAMGLKPGHGYDARMVSFGKGRAKFKAI